MIDDLHRRRVACTVDRGLTDRAADVQTCHDLADQALERIDEQAHSTGRIVPDEIRVVMVASVLWAADSLVEPDAAEMRTIAHVALTAFDQANADLVAAVHTLAAAFGTGVFEAVGTLLTGL